MNKDRIEGSVEQAKGKVKEVAGKVTGDSKLETEGKARSGRRQGAEHRRRHQGRGEGSRRRLMDRPQRLNCREPGACAGFFVVHV